MEDQRIRAYLDAQNSSKNRSWVLAFPTLYPREILTAMEVIAWEVWAGTPGNLECPDAGKLQGYLCPTVRGALAVLSRKRHGAKVAILPHTCDSLQGLATVARATPEWGVRAVTFRHPRGTDRPAARAFLRREIASFITEMEQAVGRTLDLGRLASAIELHRKVENTLERVLRGRAFLPLSDEALYAVLRCIEWMHPEDYLVELEAIEKQIAPSGERRPGIGLVVSGMVPEPAGLFETLADVGAYVAADDYAVLGRRIPAYEGAMPGDPIGAVAERLLLMPACPTRASDSSLRIARLRRLAVESGARGVILQTVKFCEPELFDVPVVRRGLEDVGLKVLHVETEHEVRVTGQIATRLEAFVEMLQSGGSR